MTESRFKISNEGDERLKIKTPFPVTQNVWSYFVFKIFPDFQTPIELIYPEKHNGRYLNRRREFDEIADGQINGYIHAYLPHFNRTPLKEDIEGLIHVPNIRKFYLDQIKGDLYENQESRTGLLASLKTINSETFNYLFNELNKVQNNTIFRDIKTTKELRDKFGKYLVNKNLLQGYYTDYGTKPCLDTMYINKIPLGSLPLFMRGNVDHLRTQICLDFLRELDSVLINERNLNKNDLSKIQIIIKDKLKNIL